MLLLLVVVVAAVAAAVEPCLPALLLLRLLLVGWVWGAWFGRWAHRRPDSRAIIRGVLPRLFFGDAPVVPKVQRSESRVGLGRSQRALALAQPIFHSARGHPRYRVERCIENDAPHTR